MTASEARTIVEKSTTITKVREELDKAIKNKAKDGFYKLNTYVYMSHPCEMVIDSLKKDGFKAACQYCFDERDGEMWLYKISW